MNIKITIFAFIIFLKTAFFLCAGEIGMGDVIQNFSANDDNGNLWRLDNNLNQKYLIVYFYPAAFTGG